MRIAVISDIHGHNVALKEVIRDIEYQGVNIIIKYKEAITWVIC